MKRQDWAVARQTIRTQVARRSQTCVEKGHPVYRVGPYLICRSLSCSDLVVDEGKANA